LKKKVAIGSDSGTVNIYNADLTNTNSFQAHTNTINGIKLLPNGFVATCSDDSTLKMWNPSNWNRIRTYTGHTSEVYCLEYIDSERIATGSEDKTIRIWSIKSGQTIQIINTYSPVYCLQLLSNGFHLAAGLSSNITIYDINTGFVISTLAGHSSAVRDLALIGTDLLASGGWDNSIRIWNLTTSTLKFNLQSHTYWVYGLKVISLDVLASASWDNTIKLWNIQNGSLIRTLSGHMGALSRSVDILNGTNVDQQQQSTLVSGSADKTIKLWNIKSGQLLNTISTGLTITHLSVLNIYRNSGK